MENSGRELISIKGSKLERIRALISLFEDLSNKCEKQQFMEAIEDLRKLLEEKFENQQQLNAAFLERQRRHREFLISVGSKVLKRMERREILKNNH